MRLGGPNLSLNRIAASGVNLSLLSSTNNLPSWMTFSRAAGPATYFNQSGTLTSAATNELRYDHDPNTARTNLVRNSAANGGTIGGSPTNWTLTGVVSGITITTVGTDVIDGRRHWDVRFLGTATASNGFGIHCETNTGIPAVNNEQFTNSWDVALVAGSISGVASIRNNLNLRDSGGVNLSTLAGTDYKAGLTSTLSRFSTTSTTNNASTAFVRPLVNVDWPNGAVIDMTLRVRAPQTERNGTATDYIETTGTARTVCNPRGPLIELAQTNLITTSAVAAAATGTTVTADTTLAPDGTTTADTITATAVLNPHLCTFGGAVSVTLGLSYATTVFARAGTHSFIQILGSSASYGASAWANFDITSGTVGTVGAAATASIRPAGEGWFRCEVIYPATATDTTGRPSFYLISSATAARAESWTTVGTETVQLWGAQVEQASFASSYIPTTSGAATRPVDVLTVDTVNFPVAFPNVGVACTIVAEWEPRAVSAPWRIVNISGAADTNRLTLRHSTIGNVGVGNVESGGVEQASMGAGTLTANTVARAAVAFAANDFATSVNGSAVVTDTLGTMPTGLDRARFGADLPGSNVMSGWLRYIGYIPSRVPNAQLQTLSTP